MFAAIFLAAGVLLGMTDWLSPIHEMFHYRAAQIDGIPARIVSATRTETAQYTDGIIWAGWAGELVWASMLAGMFAIVGRFGKWRWQTGALPLGYGIVTFVRGFGSFDFTDAVRAWINSVYPDTVKQLQVYEAVRVKLLGTWELLGGMFLVPALLFVVGCILIPRKKRGGQHPV
jgi:hypothetical protein